jgi:hypothetical protein
MKAIIIEDKDARALVDQLQLLKMQGKNLLSQIIADDPATGVTVAEVHRAFHYVVVRWLQDQGASVTR